MEQLNPDEITPLERVTAYQPLWSEYRKRLDRTAGLDSKLAGEFKVINNRMNQLLQALYDQVVEPFSADAPYERRVENFGKGKTLYEPTEYDNA